MNDETHNTLRIIVGCLTFLAFIGLVVYGDSHRPVKLYGCQGVMVDRQ